MSREVSTAGRSGRFARINPERPERHSGYPVENRSYSPGAFPENLSIYEKGTGAAYMAAAGWSTNSIGDENSRPTAYQPTTTFGKNSSGKNRCLLIAFIILLLILILLVIAIVVLFATKVVVLNTRTANSTTLVANSAALVGGTTVRSSSDAVGAATTTLSSANVSPNTFTSTSTTSTQSAFTLQPRVLEIRTFSCTIVILDMAIAEYNNKSSYQYAFAIKDITNMLTSTFMASYFATSIRSIQVNNLTNQGRDVVVSFTLALSVDPTSKLDASMITNVLAIAATRTDANAPFRSLSIATDRITVVNIG